MPIKQTPQAKRMNKLVKNSTEIIFEGERITPLSFSNTEQMKEMYIIRTTNPGKDAIWIAGGADLVELKPKMLGLMKGGPTVRFNLPITQKALSQQYNQFEEMAAERIIEEDQPHTMVSSIFEILYSLQAALNTMPTTLVTKDYETLLDYRHTLNRAIVSSTSDHELEQFDTKNNTLTLDTVYDFLSNINPQFESILSNAAYTTERYEKISDLFSQVYALNEPTYTENIATKINTSNQLHRELKQEIQTFLN